MGRFPSQAQNPYPTGSREADAFAAGLRLGGAAPGQAWVLEGAHAEGFGAGIQVNHLSQTGATLSAGVLNQIYQVLQESLARLGLIQYAPASSSSGSRSALNRSPRDGSARWGRNRTILFLRWIMGGRLGARYGAVPAGYCAKAVY